MERCPETVVVDSSVVAKWFIPSVNTDEALGARGKYVTGELHMVAPYLLLYEVSNALRYREDISQLQIDEDVETLFRLELDLESPNLRIMLEAVREARNMGISIYEACCVSLAESRGTSLITAEGRLRERVGVTGYSS